MSFNLIPSNDKVINAFWKIIIEYYKICPDALYHKLSIPVINNILLYETRSYVVFPVAEYNKVKTKINPNVLKLLDQFIDESNINLADNRMENPLTYAVMSNHLELTKYLLDNDTNINYKSYGNGIINVFYAGTAISLASA